jgi:hypothetical protein
MQVLESRHVTAVSVVRVHHRHPRHGRELYERNRAAESGSEPRAAEKGASHGR